MATKESATSDALAVPEIVVGEMVSRSHPSQPDAPMSDLGRIADFIRKNLKNKRCSREFIVHHQSDTGGSTILSATEIDPRLSLDAALGEASRVAQEFYDIALGAVCAMPTATVFGVTAYDKQKQPMGAIPFRLAPPQGNEIALVTASPTEKGTLALSHDLTKVFAKQAYLATQSEVERLERLLAKSEARVEVLETKLDAQHEVIEKAQSAAWQREREKRQDQVVERQGEKLLTAGMTFGQIALARHGIKLPPGILDGGGGDKKEEALKKAILLFESLKPEQQATIAGCLEPIQVSLLGELMQAAALAKVMTAKENAS